MSRDILPMLLSDYNHPSIILKAQSLTEGKIEVMDKIQSIFNYVRDEIKFGFPPVWDRVRASETIQYGLGYCNTKATLFHALCKAADIQSRIHAGQIDINIMRGIFPSFVFPLMPSAGGHSWIEIHIDGDWRPVDSYINDKGFYFNALEILKKSGREVGYSVSHAKGDSSCEFNFGAKGFVHMGSVVEDQGTWADFSEYMSSDSYLAMTQVQKKIYPLLAGLCNRNIEKIRNQELLP